MVVERIPGEKVYIDWIGDQPEILMDSITGELKKVHFFVTTVGVSNRVYAEAFEDEKCASDILEKKSVQTASSFHHLHRQIRR